MATATKKRRTSSHYTSSTISNDCDSTLLSTRTRKSISKSRRSSYCLEETATASSSRRSSLAAAISLISIMEKVPSASQLANALDVHALYKVKVDRSSKKLNYFFGEPTPLDVCVGEIVKEGLKAMLESKVPLCYFLYYLLEEFSSENLFFFLDVVHYEAHYNDSDFDKKLAAKRILDRYILPQAKLEVNLDDRVKRTIIKQMTHIPSSPSRNIFTEAQTCTYVLLESSFIRFLHTDVYKDMLANCGELTIHYNDRNIRSAMNYLVDYLKQQKKELMHNKDKNALNDAFILLNLKHYDLIKVAIQGFIKKLFGVDYLTFSTSKKMHS